RRAQRSGRSPVMTIEGLVRERRVIICAGPGGVGKTTVAASVGLAAAHAGRRACVVTIDPARRLADALGLAELSNDPRPVEGVGPGEMWALMLDTKSTFDALVRRYAATPDQAETILANSLYRNISGALGGTQEYMAVEKLWELAEDPRFDLVVVDTPPTRNALDFLEAPERLTRFLTNRVFRALMMPTRVGLRAVNVATQMFVRTISRVVGGEVVRDTLAFFTAFEGMEEGFRERAAEMTAMLRDPGTAFVVIAAPRRDAVTEARFFAERLSASALPLEAIVVNLVTPRWGPAPQLAEQPPAALAELVANLADLERTASGEQRHIARLVEGIPGVVVVRVPIFDADVHDLAGLGEVGGFLVTKAGAA
ncbi:MAG: ArsA family ATPase, partial [Acidimicrobiaceae bacterium]|nr:ArsA family ATPase [Acidimicrobiaceae bacterium]